MCLWLVLCRVIASYQALGLRDQPAPAAGRRAGRDESCHNVGVAALARELQRRSSGGVARRNASTSIQQLERRLEMAERAGGGERGELRLVV